MTYGFIIDHRKCIGCHACTTACKSENDVALGVFRTWVKNVEKGQFPDVRRYFTVLRCNHCDNPPCVHICPTQALFKRKDGIVDFDNQYCISCRSCMAACPYDAIYIDPNTQTAAKCHYCAHRVEVGLQPACVVVCPEQAIIAGDMDDPAQGISKLLKREQVWASKPEKGTEPKLFYIDVDKSSLIPGEAMRARSYMWGEAPNDGNDRVMKQFDSSVPREVYNVSHEHAWGSLVSAYLWTKSIATGGMLVAGLAALFNVFDIFTIEKITSLAGPALGLVFIAATAGLLLADLGRPRRFLLILLHPNWRSWLVWGAYILMLFGATCLAWVVFVFAADEAPSWRMGWLAVVVSLATAGYSAFLLGQAKARDLWQSPALLANLLLHALSAGAASHLVLAAVASFPDRDLLPLLKLMSLGVAAGLAVTLLELSLPHVNKDLSLVTRMILRGRFSRRFWLGGVIGGAVLPLVLMLWVQLSGLPELFRALALVAGVLVLAGLLVLEDIWVRAGQALPLS